MRNSVRGARIKVVGVGGGGSNAVIRMGRRGSTECADHRGRPARHAADVFAPLRRHTPCTTGTSLRPLIEGETVVVREHALAGVWGREVHLLTADREVHPGPGG